MAPDLVEFLADLACRHERVVEMALFELVVFGEEGFVVGEGFDWWEQGEFVLTSFIEGSGKRERGGREGNESDLLLSSGSARKRCLNKSVFLVALPVHMSQT